jgi:hypothetical protein
VGSRTGSPATESAARSDEIFASASGVFAIPMKPSMLAFRMLYGRAASPAAFQRSASTSG